MRRIKRSRGSSRIARVPSFHTLLRVSLSLPSGRSSRDTECCGGQRGRFSNGDVYTTPTLQVLLVPSSPGDAARNRAGIYADLGGPGGWLGYPTAKAGISPGGASYSEFEHGLLVSYPNNTTQIFQQLTFHYDTARNTYGPDLGFGPYWSTNYQIYKNGTEIHRGHAQDGRHNFSSNHETQIQHLVGLDQASPNDEYTVDLQGVSSANNDIGHVSIVYTIDNAWGHLLLSATDWNGCHLWVRKWGRLGTARDTAHLGFNAQE